MFLLDSKNNEESNDVLEGIAYNEADLVLYTEGLEEYKKSGGLCSELQSGRFIIKYKNNEDTIIRSDEVGNELLFYYTSDDFWCISTSFLGLAMYLKNNGYKLTASRLEMAKFFVNTSLYEQPYNENLPIKEISLLNAEDEIVINSEGLFKIVTRKNRVENISKDFIENLNYFIESSRCLVENFVNNFEVNLELSGGIDSRIVMGLVLPYKDKIPISSDRNKTNDYTIATKLSSIFDMKFSANSYKNDGCDNIKEKWLLYKLSNIGISRTVPRPNGASGTQLSNTVRFNGGGGETIKAFYNTNSDAYYNLIKRTGFTREIECKLINDLENTLNLFNYKTNPQDAMIEIYSNYRQRYFSGRAWYYYLFGIVFAPMSTTSFQRVLMSENIEEFFGRSLEEIINKKLLFLFILCVLDKNLTIIRFDETKKDFSLEDINNIELLLKKYKKNDCLHRKARCFGRVKKGSILPKWINVYSDLYDDCSNYEDIIYKDILDVVDKIKNIKIINESYIESLEKDIMIKNLSKNDKLACLHLNTILNIASTVDE